MSKKRKQDEETPASSTQAPTTDSPETSPEALGSESSATPESTQPSTDPESKTDQTVPITEQQKETGYREPEKFKDPVSQMADPRDQPSNFGTPISNTVHTKEQEVGDQKPIEEGEQLPTPPSPAIRYAPGMTQPEQEEAKEFDAVTPPGGVVGKTEDKPFFPRELTIVGSKRLVEHALEEQKSSAGSSEEQQRYTMGFQIAKLTLDGLKLEPNQRARFNIKWSEQGVPTISHTLEEVALPRGASSVEQLEEEEQKARSAE